MTSLGPLISALLAGADPNSKSSAQSSRVRTNDSVDPLKDRSERAAEYERQFRASMAENPSNGRQIITECDLSNTTVNMEIGILRRILKRAKRWHFVEDEVPRLPERRDIGRALQPEEKLRLLKVAHDSEALACYQLQNCSLHTSCRLGALCPVPSSRAAVLLSAVFLSHANVRIILADLCLVSLARALCDPPS